jgi:hypothetical protein
MSWLGMVIALICLYLAIRVAGFMVKILLLVVVVCGLYWFASSALGLPLPF